MYVRVFVRVHVILQLYTHVYIYIYTERQVNIYSQQAQVLLNCCHLCQLIPSFSFTKQSMS